MTHQRWHWLVPVVLLGIAAQAEGGIRYSTDASEYTVLPGGSVDVHIYLEFTGEDAAQLVAENGLYGTGVTCSVLESLPLNSPPEIIQAGDIMPNAVVFDDSLGAVKSFDTYVASMLVTVDPYESDGDRGALGTLNAGVRRIELGIFRFTAGVFPGESTTMEIGDYDLSTDDTVTWENFHVLDGLIQPVTITILTEGESCPSDFDHSGFVDLDDFIGFVHAFELGGDDADFDQSGFVDLDDFIEFVHAFEAGC